MSYITYNSFNSKFFYEMQEQELNEVLKIINNALKSYDANSAGTSTYERNRNSELWQAYHNCIFNLNKFK